MNYIEEENISFTTTSEEQIKQLIATVEKETSNIQVIDELILVKSKLTDMKYKELEYNRVELLREIRSDIISRYFSREERTKKLLKYDIHFQTAYNILYNKIVYQGLLNTN